MGLDVYFRRDIANALRAVAVANTYTDERREAFLQALVSVGLAFGLEPVAHSDPKRSKQIPQWVGIDSASQM
jgi:hypothetical protein